MVETGLRVTRVCIGADAPYGTRTEATPWGTLVGLATGSETGWDVGARCIGDPALALMFEVLRGEEPGAGLAEAFAAVSRWLAEDPRFAARADDVEDEGLPMMTGVAAAIEAERITVAWVGHDKAYVLRDGRVFAESEEHSWRMALRGGGLTRARTPVELAPVEPNAVAWRTWALQHPRTGHARTLLNSNTLAICRDVRGPPAVMQVERRPGDVLVLLGGGIHRELGWDAGVRAALAGGVALTVARIVAEFDRGEAVEGVRTIGGSGAYGPIVIVEL